FHCHRGSSPFGLPGPVLGEGRPWLAPRADRAHTGACGAHHSRYRAARRGFGMSDYEDREGTQEEEEEEEEQQIPAAPPLPAGHTSGDSDSTIPAAPPLPGEGEDELGDEESITWQSNPAYEPPGGWQQNPLYRGQGGEEEEQEGEGDGDDTGEI